jgi:hypothetical protein
MVKCLLFDNSHVVISTSTTSITTDSDPDRSIVFFKPDRKYRIIRGTDRGSATFIGLIEYLWPFNLFYLLPAPARN